jgi:hypothetical protein
MAIFAVLMPAAMLVVLLALGRYEDVMLPVEVDDTEAPRSPEADTAQTVILTGGAPRGPGRGPGTPGMFEARR